MSEIINISLESDLSEFTSTVTDGGDLYWSADAALAGTSGGMACLIDDTTAIYGKYDLGTSSTTGSARLRFYLDINNLSMSASAAFPVLYAFSTTWGPPQFGVYLNYDSGYKINVGYWRDGGTGETSDYSITDNVHYIEILYVRATDSGSSDGSLQLWIDGNSKETISTIDNYDTFVNFDGIWFGVGSGATIGTTSGTFYLDELVVNDDGSEIGPVGGPADLSASTSDGLTLGESMQSVASLGNIDVALDNANYQGRGVRII